MNSKSLVWNQSNDIKELKIWELLIEEKIINQNDLNQILLIQKEYRQKWRSLLIWELLIEKWIITRKKLLEFIEKNKIRIKIWDLLLFHWKINEEQLNVALDLQKKDTSKKIWDILVDDLKYISRETLIRSIAEQNNFIRIKPEISLLDTQFFFSIDQNFIKKEKVIPYKKIIDEESKKETWIFLISNLDGEKIKYLKEYIYWIQKNYLKNSLKDNTKKKLMNR